MPSVFDRLNGHKPPKAPSAPQVKASRTGPLIALHSNGQPRWSPRDYATLAREGFQRNPIVYRAVRMIAEAAASLPWLAYEGTSEHDHHPALELLRAPNTAQSGAAFFESLYAYLLIAGNCYIELIAVEDTPKELHILRPDRMKIVPGEAGWPEAYEYSVNGQVMRFTVPDDPLTISPILHLPFFHPLDDYYGFSPLEAAQVPIDNHNMAGAWNKALLDNAARPSGALVYVPAEAGETLTAEQYERLKHELEASFQGASNAGRPLLLEGGLDWKAMGLTPADMDFINAKNSAARDIALTFGVPPMLLGIPGDATYANYQEANRAFWRQTILPLAKRIAQSLTNWFAPVFGNAFRLDFDLDQVIALSQEQERLWTRVQNANFLTLNEKREAVGYAPLSADEIADIASGKSESGD